MARPPLPPPHGPMDTFTEDTWLAWDHGYALGLHIGWQIGWENNDDDRAARHAAIARRFRETALSPSAAELARRRGDHQRAAYLEALAVVRGFNATAPSVLEGPWPPAPAGRGHGQPERGAA